ncbi:hypothetical protein HKX48_006918 [Thoreauomyces humboldtii]|nr:hypothetical protein HKX48_006918 [Thoreauomyces humboldtii]
MSRQAALAIAPPEILGLIVDCIWPTVIYSLDYQTFRSLIFTSRAFRSTVYGRRRNALMLAQAALINHNYDGRLPLSHRCLPHLLQNPHVVEPLKSLDDAFSLHSNDDDDDPFSTHAAVIYSTSPQTSPLILSGVLGLIIDYIWPAVVSKLDYVTFRSLIFTSRAFRSTIYGLPRNAILLAQAALLNCSDHFPCSHWRISNLLQNPHVEPLRFVALLGKFFIDNHPITTNALTLEVLDFAEEGTNFPMYDTLQKNEPRLCGLHPQNRSPWFFRTATDATGHIHTAMAGKTVNLIPGEGYVVLKDVSIDQLTHGPQRSNGRQIRFAVYERESKILSYFDLPPDGPLLTGAVRDVQLDLRGG